MNTELTTKEFFDGIADGKFAEPLDMLKKTVELTGGDPYQLSLLDTGAQNRIKQEEEVSAKRIEAFRQLRSILKKEREKTSANGKLSQEDYALLSALDNVDIIPDFAVERFYVSLCQCS